MRETFSQKNMELLKEAIPGYEESMFSRICSCIDDRIEKNKLCEYSAKKWLLLLADLKRDGCVKIG